MKSWKTTALGILGGLLLIATEAKDLLDSDPKTVFEWDKVTMGLGLLGVGAFARDNNVTSKQAGAE